MKTTEQRLQYLRSRVRDVADFLKPGIMFKDITPLLGDPRALGMVIDLLAERFAESKVDLIVGIESRGFLFAAPLAVRLGAGFVPARKPGKLPSKTDSVSYSLEYGTDSLELHSDAIHSGARVLVVDDVIATGGTAWAAAELVRRQGGDVLGAAFLLELTFLPGRARIAPVDSFSLLTY
jgi:adenine phosphoribosyltransferase